MRRVILALAGTAGLVFIMAQARCFSPDLGDCAYVCGTSEPRCPDEYQCLDDGICHLKGTNAKCPAAPDLMTPPRPADLGKRPDGGGMDGGGRDLGEGADLAPAPDLSMTSDAAPMG